MASERRRRTVTAEQQVELHAGVPECRSANILPTSIAQIPLGNVDNFICISMNSGGLVCIVLRLRMCGD
jgi:hypothetical protein